MNYTGKSRRVRVRIVATSGHWAKYQGQTCDGILYEAGVNPQIDSDQLVPPLPRYQSIPLDDVQVLRYE